MSIDLPEGLIRPGGTPEFTQDTIPAGLRAAQALAPGLWGLLHNLEGGLVFVDEATGGEDTLLAPVTRSILSEMHHNVRVTGPLVYRIDFYKAPAG